LFSNLVNIHDIPLVVEKIRQGQLRKILSKLFRGRAGRLVNSWNHVEIPPKNWWDIPEVMERWNSMLSGDPGTDYFTFFLNNYFAGRDGLHALTLGCGTGYREILLSRLGKFECIDAIDISRARIEHARRKADEGGCGGEINYIVGDVYDYRESNNRYDLVLVEQSLHHFSPLEKILRRINGFMKEDGYFIFNEFVGPSRFQWTQRQIDIVNGLLSVLPKRYRKRWNSGTIKRKVHRRGRLGMILYDHTEAVESDHILPLIQKIFNVVEIRGYGGTILQLLFADIAHNFKSKDTETQHLLRMCFELEDLLLESGELQHDFVVGICRKGG
jgi:ubiquinone/menaquinone biosynthesis C-methylase UbiE